MFHSLFTKRVLTIAFLSLFFFAALGEGKAINFAGYEWYVKSGTGGPNGNEWSDSPRSVWVDSDGLHLKIRPEDGIWKCAEVYTKNPTSYGRHKFYIDAKLDELDPNVVAAVFLYADDDHELDIEVSKWSETYARTNSQYVVQGLWKTSSVYPLWTSLSGTYTTHFIDWYPDSVWFKSVHGHYQNPSSGSSINEWRYSGYGSGIIPSERDNLRVHINLWLCNPYHHPSNFKEAEIVIKDVDLP